MPDDARSEPPATPGEQAEARGHIYDLLSRVSRLEGQFQHLATRNHVTKAKLWMVVSAGACIVSIIAALAAIITTFLRFMGAS